MLANGRLKAGLKGDLSSPSPEGMGPIQDLAAGARGFGSSLGCAESSRAVLVAHCCASELFGSDARLRARVYWRGELRSCLRVARELLASARKLPVCSS